MRAIISLVCGLFLFAACDPDDNQGPPELEVNFVTGINLSDENGLALGKKGNPNVKPEGVAVFPNPVLSGVMQVAGQQSITNLWLVEGIAQKTAATDIQSLLENHEYTTEDIKAFPVLEFTPNDTTFAIDVSMLEKGYYRVFLQRADGAIVWDNIYLSPGATFADTWTELGNFWD